MFKTEPPAAAALAPLDRRSLLKSSVLGAGLIAAPLSAQLGASGFTHGVASGEPGRDRVLLWTRFVAGTETRLEWEVSPTADFSRVVASGEALASPSNDNCCKTFAEGLEPGRWYFYRFVAPNGAVSDVGRTKTLPEGPTERFRMAVFSCSNLSFGWFNAYAHAAEANEFDCAMHLGDYFYEYGAGYYPSPEQTVGGRSFEPMSETVALADYRLRFASYRDDRDLRRLHQVYPMIAGWDDHESANDSWKGGAENHQPETEGEWSVRKAAAIRAYREWMPVSDEHWASYEVGDLATLFRLETRLTARAEQFSYAELLQGQSSPEAALRALTAFRQGDYFDPTREMLGAQQQAWLAAGLKRSTAGGKRWQVLVQQVLMGKLATAPRLLESLPPEIAPEIRSRVVAGTLASRAGLPLNMDAWDGYPAARERVFEAALAADANLVSLAGDTHNAWTFDLEHAGQRVGVELGVQSVTSPGLETYLPQIAPGDLARASIEHNQELVWMDASRRGYMAVELTPTRMIGEFRFQSSVRERGAGVVATHRVLSELGSRRLEQG